MASDLPHKAGFFPKEGKEKAAGLSGKLGEKQEGKKNEASLETQVLNF